MILDKLLTIREKLSPNLQKSLANVTWLFADKVLQLGLALFVGLWVARYLKPDGFGKLNYMMAMAGLFAPLAGLGFNSIVLRDLARDPSCQSETMGTTFVLKIIASFLTIFLTLITVFILNPGDYQLYLMVGIISSATIFQQIIESIDCWFTSQTQSKYSVWSTNSAYLFISGIKLVLINLRASLIAFCWVIPIEKALASLAILTTYHLKGSELQGWTFSWSRGKELLRQSWFLILSSFVVFIYMRIDQVMLGQMSTSQELGVYAAAVKISELWYFIPGSIVQSLFPSIVQAKELGDSIYYSRIQKLLYVVSFVAYFVAIPLTFLSRPIILLLYGRNYIEAAPSLTVLIWAGLFVSLGVSRNPWLITEGLMKFSAATTSLGALVNVILNLILIPKYGGFGAGVATLISQIIAAYAAHGLYPQTRPMFWMQTKAIFFFDFWKKILPR